jgi:Tripartite tricarboxylate transporter family receptor
MNFDGHSSSFRRDAMPRACAALAASSQACYNAIRNPFNDKNKTGENDNAVTTRRDQNGSDRSRHGVGGQSLCAGLSDTAGAVPGWLSARRRDRYSGEAHRPAAVGTARPAIRDREQAGRRQQHRHRGGDQFPARRLYRPPGQPGELHQHHALCQSAERSSQLPDVQAIAETVPGYEASALFGMGAQKSTPKDIIEKLNSEINAIMQEPDMRKRLIELGGEPLIQSSDAFGDMIKAETAKWKKVVEFAGLKVE